MRAVKHWDIKNVKAECFTGDTQLDVLDAINRWFQEKQDVVLLGIGSAVHEDFVEMTVFYD